MGSWISLFLLRGFQCILIVLIIQGLQGKSGSVGIGGHTGPKVSSILQFFLKTTTLKLKNADALKKMLQGSRGATGKTGVAGALGAKVRP